MNQIQHLARVLSNDLLGTCSAYKDFAPKYTEDLDDEDMAARNLALNEIEAAADKLGQLKEKLDNVTRLCDSYSQSVSLPA